MFNSYNLKEPQNAQVKTIGSLCNSYVVSGISIFNQTRSKRQTEKSKRQKEIEEELSCREFQCLGLLLMISSSPLLSPPT